MKTYYVTNHTVVDRDTEEALELSNNETGDRSVQLVRARGVSCEGLGTDPDCWVYYLQTNGDPVAITDDPVTLRDAAKDLGCEVATLRDTCGL